MKLRIVAIFLFVAIATAAYSQKVVGGQNAGQYEYKFLAGFGYRDGVVRNPEDHFCGGSLIREDWILTAAHCLYDDDGNPLTSTDFFAFLNVWQLDNPNAQMERYNVTNIIKHADYDDVSSANDIALIRISSKSSLNPISLPTQNNETLLTVGKKCTVAGWGATNNAGTQYPTIQQKVELEVISNSTCNQSTWYDGEVLANMLCAGYAAGQKDACFGDSGGPLFVMEGGDTTQIGVVSWGVGCAEARQPGVYTKVSSYINWINTNIAAATSGIDQARLLADFSVTGQQGKLRFASSSKAPLTVSVSTMAGAEVVSIPLGINEQMDFQIASGVYIVSCATNGTKIVKKVLVW